MNWTFLNRAVEQLTGLTRKDVLGQQCSKWGATICGTGKCGICMLEKGQLTSYFNQPGKIEDFQVDTAYIKDENGNDIGHIEKVILKNSPKDANGDLSGYSIHLADYASDNQEVEKLLDLRSLEEERLSEINEAFEKLDNGKYGICEHCECDITIERLFAKPTAKFCVKCREALEAGRI